MRRGSDYVGKEELSLSLSLFLSLLYNIDKELLLGI